MALFGALCLTILAGVAVFICLGLPYIAIGFGGPTKANVTAFAIGVTLAGGVVFGWWHFVGTNIHLSFG